MPKIERSVDYTFEAYSGVEDGEQDSKFNVNLSEMNFQNSNIDNMDDSSDIDDASKYFLKGILLVLETNLLFYFFY